jgi:hypothetical protein
MDAASVWPTRQIHRDAAKLPPIISVVKINLMGKADGDALPGSFALLRSMIGALRAA